MFAGRPSRRIVRAVTLSAVIGVLGLGTSARAAETTHEMKHENKGPGSMAQLMKMSPEECMQMMDKEHKGFITKKEFMKFQEDLWKKMDKNHDGKVTQAEFTDAG
jgi:hypothetical protein